MDKVAIVVQRYSEDINGGAELHAKLLAEHLKDKYDIDVITSCSNDYLSWDNYYKEGTETINGINVIRFQSEKKDIKEFKKLSHYFYRNLDFDKKRYNITNFPYLFIKKNQYKTKENHNQLFEEWIEKQGPLCNGLINYLKENYSTYSAFIFFTYLYYPTYFGLPEVAYKSILIPTAHDESPFYFSGFKKLFSMPRFIMYNTDSEKELVEKTYFQTQSIKSDIAGVGFEKPEFGNFIKPKIDYEYFLYIGRIDINKGCKKLVDYFIHYKKSRSSNIKLVMIGKDYMNSIKHDDDIIYTGYISEQEKLSYLHYCNALIIPSKFESLSMVTLETMVMGKPVIANGECDVLKKHIEKSKAGYVYYNKPDFCMVLDKISNMKDQDKSKIADNGKLYVENNYQWFGIINKFVKAIKYISNDEE